MRITTNELTRPWLIIQELEAENAKLKQDLAMALGRLGAVRYAGALETLAETPVDHSEPAVTNGDMGHYDWSEPQTGCTGVTTAEGGE